MKLSVNAVTRRDGFEGNDGERKLAHSYGYPDFMSLLGTTERAYINAGLVSDPISGPLHQL